MFFEIIRSDSNIDFVRRWPICVGISVAMIVLLGIGIAVRGVKLGIDFAGGTEVQVHFADGVEADEGSIRSVVSGLDIENASVIRYGEGRSEYLIKFQGERRVPGATAPDGSVTAENDRILGLEKALGEKIGPLDVERVEFVGPKVGAELRDDGLKALGIACVLILIYIWIRFSVRFAPGAVVALFHDVLVTSSVWVLFGLEFDLRVLAALLAIVGYSLNDTIIVYDRIRENMETHTRHDLGEVLNRSVNQTLSRTLLTSGTTMLAVVALLVFGGDVIWPFALAMTIGIVVGTYSSIYIASPMLLWLEARFPSDAPASGRNAPAAKKGARA